jgi:hypothetical protein
MKFGIFHSAMKYPGFIFTIKRSPFCIRNMSAQADIQSILNYISKYQKNIEENTLCFQTVDKKNITQRLKLGRSTIDW